MTSSKHNSSEYMTSSDEISEVSSNEPNKTLESDPSIWTKFVGVMDIHGLHQISSTSSTARIIWIGLLTLSTVVMIANIAICAVDYVNNPIITTYSLNQESSLLLPKLYICPFNYVNKTILDYNVYTQERIDVMVREYLKNDVVETLRQDEKNKHHGNGSGPNIGERILLNRRSNGKFLLLDS